MADLDIMKIFNAVKLQLAIVVILGIISIAALYVTYSSAKTLADVLAAGQISLVLGLVALIVTVWAGYVAAKTLKGGAVEGGIAGALISVISGIISGVLSLLLVSPLLAALSVGAAALPVLGALTAGIGAIAMIVGIVISAIIGFILGAIGGFVGQKK